MNCTRLLRRSTSQSLINRSISISIQLQVKTCKRFASSNQNESMVSRGWRRLAVAIRTFMAGTKALYKDVTLMYEIRSTHGKYTITNTFPKGVSHGLPLSRSQLQFTYSTKKNLIKMLPTVALFFVPVLGYVVPLVAFMYPDKLLSNQFWTDDQRKLFTLSEAKRSEEIFKSLMRQVRTALSQKQLDSVADLGEKFKDADLNWEQGDSLFQNPFLPYGLTTNQSGLLCNGWGLRTWLPIQSRQRLLLERHMNYLFTCDWLLSLEGGVESLTDKEVVEACAERKIIPSDNTADVTLLRTLLKTWTTLTTNVNECPTSLMAHLPMTQFHDVL